MKDYIYRYEGGDSHGVSIWSCTREGAGICGYGATMEDALQAFLDVEQELIPLPRYETIDCGPFEPRDEGRRIPEYREE